ncbi:MAG: 50S ribosomal protein L9 [Bradymonadia bacterium]
MKVILRENVSNLGHIGDVVAVKDGYARNFLLPRNLAVPANDRQLKRVEHEKRIIERKSATMKVEAEGRKAKLDKVTLTISKAVGENEKLFGSVTSMEIQARLKDEGFEVDRRNIQLTENIKHAGVFEVSVKLFRDVVATIKVHVVAKNPPPVKAEEAPAEEAPAAEAAAEEAVEA